jgi:GH25 family lysozyme M1 (1,4-beta-N-acetylmuramidase)
VTDLTQRRWSGVRLRLLALVPLVLLGTALVPTADAAAPLSGVDVSKYQHPKGLPIDWARVKASGQSFAIIKASGGSDTTDPWFAREWAAAGKAGMIRAAYHYADPSEPADAQAAHVVDVVGSTREANDLGIVLDLESTGGLTPRQLSAWAHAFLSGVERRTGRVPILYSGPSFWHYRMADDRSFGAYPLWLARYSSKAPGPLPGWDRWTIWQHTSSARVPGIPTAVDHDVFCCGAGTLAALADGRSVAITKLWRALGGASGQLGLPMGTETAVPGGWAQTFERGLVTTTGQGTWAVLGDTYARYTATGGPTGPLGLPNGAEAQVLPGVWQQPFQHGVIARSATTGAHAVYGPALGRWLADGGPRSAEGLPTAEPTPTAQQFANGGLYATPTGPHLLPTAIRDRYQQLGGEQGVLGLPVSEPHDMFGATVVDFQLGELYDVVVAGQHVVI